MTIRHRLTAALVAGALALSFSASALDSIDLPLFRSAGTHMYSATMQVGSNATYQNNIYWHETNNREESYSLSYTPGGDVVPMVVYGTRLWGTNRINTITNFLEEKGYNVVGGMNADYFSSKTGLPMGIVINEGRLITYGDQRAAVFFHQDGSAFIAKPSLSFTLKNHGGSAEANNAGHTMSVPYFNQWRQPHVPYLLSNDFSTQTHVSTAGRDVVMRITDGGVVRTSGTVELEVVEVRDSLSSSDIPEDCLILTCDEKCSAYGDTAGFAVGDKVTLTVQNDDSRIDSAWYATGGGSPSTGDGILLENGEIAPNLGTGRHPRSAIGIKADGSVVLYAIDGRQSDHSNGLTEWDLADELKQQGCVSALNLDGGGSTALSVRREGESEVTPINSPSDGMLRSCSTYIMLVNKASSTGTAHKLSFSDYGPIVLTGSDVTLPTADGAVDNTWKPVAMPDGVTYSVDESIGTLNEYGWFKASETAAQGYLYADAGGILGANPITVAGEVDYFTTQVAGGGTELTSLTVQPGEQVQLEHYAWVAGRDALCSPSAFTYSLTPDVGTITEGGLFTASDINGVKGTLTVSFGSRSTSIPISVGAEKPVKVEDFERDSHIFSSSGVTRSTVRDNIQYGSGSGQFSYRFSGGQELETVRYASTPVSFLKAPTALYAWVKGDGSGNRLSAEFTDAEGNVILADFDKVLSFQNYTLLSAPVQVGNRCSFTGLVLTNASGQAGEGTFYVDQIFSKGALSDDTKPPEVSLYVEGNKVTAFVNDDSGMDWQAGDIHIRVDGQELAVSGMGSAASATADFSAAGVHRVTAWTTDAFGNMGSAAQDVKNGTAPSTFLDMNGHWASPYVQFAAQRGVIAGEGVSGGYRYNPEKNITRAEFCAMTSRFLGLDSSAYASAQVPFTDTASIPSWAINDVKAMYSLGYVNGKTAANGALIFDPNAPITRQEIFSILGKTVAKGYERSGSITAKDASSIASWALDGAKALTYLGVVSGYEDGTIRPTRNVTRAEVARMLYCLY